MKQIKISRLGKQFINLIEQELLAIISVGVVLAFLFSQSMAAGLPEEIALAEGSELQATEATVQTITDVSPSAGEVLFHGQPTIDFGSDIKGITRTDFEIWPKETGIKNFGNYLQILEKNEVTILGVSNGSHNIYVKAFGTLNINGVGFTFKTIRTLVKTIQVTNGSILIKFTAGAQIYTISTLQLEKETAENEPPAVPASIAVLPFHSTLVLNKYTPATFRPLVIVLDQDGKQISTTSGSLKWTTSDSNVATVDTNGLVIPKLPGSVTITVQVNGTELIAATSVLIRAAEEVPIIDITTPRTQSAAPTTEATNTTTTEENQTNTIAGFFTELFNLKPSSAANLNPATTTQTAPAASITAPAAASPTASADPGLLSKLITSVQNGMTTAALFIQQTLGQLVAQLIH
ncbi:MAG: Ig-like domain-containing protein [Patescibacteria group bacterium]|jgi:hypothetical protein